MNLNDLRKIARYKHLSEYSESELIMNLGLYDSVIIDTGSINTVEEKSRADNENIFYFEEVSKDVKALHTFLNSKNIIEITCPRCEKARPYTTVGWFNPFQYNKFGSYQRQKRYEMLPEFSNFADSDRDVQAFLKRLKYDKGSNFYSITSWDSGDDEVHHVLVLNNAGKYKEYLATLCMNEIIDSAYEIRKDFICTMNPDHHCSIGFILEIAVSSKPDELLEFEKRVAIDPAAKMTDEEREAAYLYEQYKYSIIMKKVSQNPSMADMQLFDIEKYRKVLGKQHADYRRALGLYASGIGAGSFVYLRRIFENIVEDVHQTCKNIKDWDEEQYKKLRFNEKIEYLEKYGEEIIPKELYPVKNKLYGVISKGVHESGEKECLEIFMYLKEAIDLLLDKRIAEKERAEKLQRMVEAIQNVDS